MVEKENVEEMKDAERRESLAEMMGAEMKGLLETIIKDTGLPEEVKSIKESLKKVLDNFKEDQRHHWP